MTDSTVQGQPSTTEIVQSPVEPTKPNEVSTEPVAVQPAPPEKSLDEKIADAVAKALAVETEKSRREIQSAKDRAMAELQGRQSAERRARLAENTQSAVTKHLQSLDPDVAKEFELAQLRAEREGRMTLEQEEQMRQQQTDFHSRFQSGLTTYAQSVGVDVKDARLDWNIDPADYLGSQQRFLSSVAKIQNDKVKSLEASIDTKIKESEKRIKKDLGVDEVNSVSTQMSGGVSAKGIPTDMTKFRAWVRDLPEKEYKALKTDIDSMLAKGQIK